MSRGTAATGGKIEEKLIRWGTSKLDDVELVALLVGRGRSASKSIATAHGILERAGGLTALTRSPPGRLLAVPGVGRAAAGRIAAAGEIGRRVGGIDLRAEIRTPEQAVRQVPELTLARRETMTGLYLDAQTRLVARETVAIGSLNVARARPRDVLEPAIRNLAAGFVLLHNHPSGSLEPSDDDLRFTKQIGGAAWMMGVPLFDHLIVGRTGFVSLRSRGVTWEGQAGG